ncbi:MAG: hypothetical protein R3308_03850 [Thiohalobacterales bacterium]|nr:hypothetical protein [Thiohalobacterales bacterium]
MFLTDPLLLVLLVLLAASLTAFLLDIIPWPVGIILLVIFITARVLYLKGRDQV